MSFDLEIATQEMPREETVRVFLARSPGVTVEGSWKGRGNLLAEHSGHPLFTIDPPAHPDPEALGSTFALRRPRPRWLTFLSIPAAGLDAGALELAHALGMHMAATANGLIYDPQTDEFEWPNGHRETVQRQPEQRISILKTEWFFSSARLSIKTVEHFLAIADRILPAVTPRKRADFLAWARDPDQSELRDLFYWTGRKPCYNGSAGVHRGARYSDDRRVPAWRLSLALDEETVRTSRKTRDAVVALFTSVAAELGAFYAAAYVEREWIREGRTLWSDGLTDRHDIRIPAWLGIPRQAMWLSWFGLPYRALIGSEVQLRAETIGDGLLLRVSELPADPRELAVSCPHLPPAITGGAIPEIVIKHYDDWRGTIEHVEQREERAELIPPLE